VLAMSSRHRELELFRFLGSAGCQPAVAHVILEFGTQRGLGKLPRPAGWQSALP
jgi:hypothetical protein